MLFAHADVSCERSWSCERLTTASESLNCFPSSNTKLNWQSIQRWLESFAQNFVDCLQRPISIGAERKWTRRKSRKKIVFDYFANLLFTRVSRDYWAFDFFNRTLRISLSKSSKLQFLWILDTQHFEKENFLLTQILENISHKQMLWLEIM